jgi:hypothetical protein
MDGLKNISDANYSYQLSYDVVYNEIYQTAYNASFVFSDEDDEFIDYDINTFDLPLAPAGFGTSSSRSKIRYKVFQVIIAKA